LFRSGDAPAFGDAASAANIRLHDSEPAGPQVFGRFVTVHQRIAGDRQVEGLGEQEVSFHVFGGDGQFEKTDFQLFQRPAEPQGLRAIVDACRVRMNDEVVANAFANRPHGTNISFDSLAERHFYAFETAFSQRAGFFGQRVELFRGRVDVERGNAGGVDLDRRSETAAEELTDRHRGRLSPDIPQSDVDAGNRLQVKSGAMAADAHP